MTFDDHAVLRVGAWRVDPTAGEISCAGETHRLEPRTMRLLLYLASHPGQVVQLDRLLDEVWPGVVVTPSSVYQAVAQLRRLLGDNTSRPSYIDTLSRRGYRLVASVGLWLETESADLLINRSEPSVLQPSSVTDATRVRTQWRGLAVALMCAVLAGAGLLWFMRTASRTTSIPPTVAAFAPPPHSIAVLPFANLSGDPNQEYFSDGLTEELLNSLARINELQVAARTSSFYFKGAHADLATIAHKLNVAAVLEGGVRRSTNTVRITARLVDTATGFQLWSQTYDRDLGDVLRVQADIADAVAGALKVTLFGDVAAKIELGGTRNPDALDAYLRGWRAYITANDLKKDMPTALAAYTEAVSLDPGYALAFAERSLVFTSYARMFTGSARRDCFEKAEADARRAIALAPELAEGHFALANVFDRAELDFVRASEEYERALTLAPGKARMLRSYGSFASRMGRADAGIAAARRALILDPLNPVSHLHLARSLLTARRYDEAVRAYQETISLEPDSTEAYANRGAAYYLLGDFQKARLSCEAKPDDGGCQSCLAITYEKLGRHADAQAMLARVQDYEGDAGAYGYAQIYALWGNESKALEWLETAVRLRDPTLGGLKTDPLIDPLRNEPRFEAIERALRFPD